MLAESQCLFSVCFVSGKPEGARREGAKRGRARGSFTVGGFGPQTPPGAGLSALSARR